MAGLDANPAEMGTTSIPGCRHCSYARAFAEAQPTDGTDESGPLADPDAALGACAALPPPPMAPSASSFNPPALPPPLRTSIVIGTNEGRVLQVPMYPIVKHSPVIRKLLYSYCEFALPVIGEFEVFPIPPF
jgi:hypothetical protein